MHYIIAFLLFVLAVTISLYIYHTFQYYKKREDMLCSFSVVDKHDAKSQAYLIASLGLFLPISILVALL